MKEFMSFLLSALRKQCEQHGFLRSRVLCALTTWNEITKSDTVTLEF